MRAPEYKTAVTVVYIAGLFIQILDATIVTVAIPSLAEEFQVGVTDVEWVIIGYSLTLAAGIPAAGWFADRFGTKRVFLAALAIFTVASALCGASGSLEQLVAFRLLQGLGAGVIVPVGSAMLYRAYPMSERATAANAVVSAVVIAPAVGPIVGGLIVETISWRWIFFVNLPIGTFAFVLGLMWLREHTEPGAGAFDRWGFVLSTGGLALVVYALSIAPDMGWTAGATLLTGGAGLIAFVALVVVELRIGQPILDLRLLSGRLFRTINIVGVFMYAGFVSQIFMLTLYLQRLRGYSALEAGLTQAPQAVGIFLFSNLVGKRLYHALGPRRMLALGTSIATVVTLAFALVSLDTPVALIGGMMLVRGVGMGASFLPMQTAAFAQVSLADTARATSLFNAQRQASNAVGVAVAATVLAAMAPSVGLGPESGSEGLDAFRAAFLACGLMFLPAVFVALKVRDEDAAETLESPPPSRAGEREQSR
jgi:EmrB/QacA subfamily drug resistance transporter